MGHHAQGCACTLSISGMELSLLRLSTITGMRSGCFALMLAALALRVSRSCFESLAIVIWDPAAKGGVREEKKAPAIVEEPGEASRTKPLRRPRRAFSPDPGRPLNVPNVAVFFQRLTPRR